MCPFLLLVQTNVEIVVLIYFLKHDNAETNKTKTLLQREQQFVNLTIRIVIFTIQIVRYSRFYDQHHKFYDLIIYRRSTRHGETDRTIFIQHLCHSISLTSIQWSKLFKIASISRLTWKKRYVVKECKKWKKNKLWKGRHLRSKKKEEMYTERLAFEVG